MTPHITTIAHQQLVEHVDQYWPTHTKRRYTWQLGPIGRTLPNFSVLCVEPSTAQESWVYVTHGAWEVDTGTESRKEFVMSAATYSPRHIETLAMLANFHADAQYRHLDVGRAVNIGRAWVEGSTCDHLLISLPYPFGPELERCKVAGLQVQYLWALPIMRSESEFMKINGLEALEQRFDAAAIDYLDPFRSSAV